MDHTRALVAEERRATRKVIEAFEEIERRGLFLVRGYSSLFEMAKREFGYTEAEAFTRITAMRVAKEVPEVKERLEQGRLSLTNITMVQTFARAEKKKGNLVGAEEKRALLLKLEGKSTREAEKVMKEISPESVPLERERVLTQTETEIRFVADGKLMGMFQELRNLWAHQNPDFTYAELFAKMAEKLLAKTRVKETVGARQPSEAVRRSRYVPSRNRTKLRDERAAGCAFQDPKTGRTCASSFGLEIDHIQPFSLGGSHEPENLRWLCRAHNLYLGKMVQG
ncbi:MAG: HNH endonuclease [Bdellovibrionota bacterium]